MSASQFVFWYTMAQAAFPYGHSGKVANGPANYPVIIDYIGWGPSASLLRFSSGPFPSLGHIAASSKAVTANLS